MDSPAKQTSGILSIQALSTLQTNDDNNDKSGRAMVIMLLIMMAANITLNNDGDG